jgi:hypothetical protein
MLKIGDGPGATAAVTFPGIELSMTDADPTALRQSSASAVGSVRRIVSRRVPHFEVAKCRKPVG